MPHECGACNGSGQCQNDFHNIYDAMVDTIIDSGGDCPACGEQAREDYTTMKKAKPTKPPSEEYSRFEQLARQVIAVPKSELDKREAAYQRKELAEKKRKAA